MTLRHWIFACTTPVLLLGCKDLVGNPPLPSGVQDPSTYNTVAGVLQQTVGIRGLLRDAMTSFILSSGELSDELSRPNTSINISTDTANNLSLDSRQLQETDATQLLLAGSDAGLADYKNLQGVRGQAGLTIGALKTYAPNQPKALQGEMYAIQGYAEVLLADLFCSGVPLTQLNFDRDFTYEPSSTTASVYQTAVAHFDSALALSVGSDSILALARIGKGRALLALGQYDAAAQAVAAVKDGDRYQLHMVLGTTVTSQGNINSSVFSAYSVSDREGSNGEAYRSSGDPRTGTILVTDANGKTIFEPTKYQTQSTDSSVVIFADGVEARLIEAEVALHRGDPTTWLQILNHLRATVAIPGAVGPLPPLVDPVDSVARIDTLFSERSAWLFLTGHRQGDLRRLIRQYRRNQQLVYPSGPYAGPGRGVYGPYVNAVIPTSERINPLFHGCLNRDA